MKKRLILIVLLLLSALMPAQAADTATVTYQVKFDQKEARAMFDMVNQFRQSEDAWYWNRDNTEKVKQTQLEDYIWDEDLAKIAMQRAAELALSFSHTRPNGDPYYMIHMGLSGENLSGGLYAYSTLQSFTALAETNFNYAGQGHRRNMLSEKHQRMGVGYCEVNGARFWVQVFAQRPLSSPYLPEVTDQVQVQVQTEMLQKNAAIKVEPASLSIKAGDKIALPEAKVSLRSDNWAGGAVLNDAEVTWSSGDEQVLRVEGGRLVGISPGTAVLTAKALGKEAQVQVTVAAGCSHSHSDKSLVKAPQCTEGGQERHTCRDCGKSWIHSLPALGHKWKTDKKEASCTENGWIKTACTNCGTVQKEEAQKAAGHQWQISSQEAGCTTAGWEKSSCTVCGAVEKKEMQPAGHRWVTDTKAATCTQAGYQQRVCTHCKQVDHEQVIPVTAHQWKDETKAATCTQAGYQQRVCAHCKQVDYERVIPVTAHQWKDETRAATCTEDGYERKVCSLCGGIDNSQVTKATGHKLIGQVALPTCSQAGYKITRCVRCNTQCSEEILKALAHQWTEEKQAATCTRQGFHQVYCTVCGVYEKNEVSAVSHSFMTEHQAATCISDGLKKTACAQCGLVKQEEVIKAPGHSWTKETKEPSCDQDGYSKTFCARCGEVSSNVKLPRTFHNMVVETVSATCTTAGSHHSLCSKCGHDYGTQVIPARGHTMMPESVTKHASCTAKGTAVTKCMYCDYAQTRTLPILPHVADGSLHLKPARCEEAGYDRVLCRSCQTIMKETILAPLSHDYQYQIEIGFGDADCSNTGYDMLKCVHCFDVKKIYKTGKHKPATETVIDPTTNQPVQRTYCTICNTSLTP